MSINTINNRPANSIPATLEVTNDYSGYADPGRMLAQKVLGELLALVSPSLLDSRRVKIVYNPDTQFICQVNEGTHDIQISRGCIDLIKGDANLLRGAIAHELGHLLTNYGNGASSQQLVDERAALLLTQGGYESDSLIKFLERLKTCSEFSGDAAMHEVEARITHLKEDLTALKQSQEAYVAAKNLIHTRSYIPAYEPLENIQSSNYRFSEVCPEYYRNMAQLALWKAVPEKTPKIENHTDGEQYLGISALDIAQRIIQQREVIPINSTLLSKAYDDNIRFVELTQPSSPEHINAQADLLLIAALEQSAHEPVSEIEVDALLHNEEIDLEIRDHLRTAHDLYHRKKS